MSESDPRIRSAVILPEGAPLHVVPPIATVALALIALAGCSGGGGDAVTDIQPIATMVGGAPGEPGLPNGTGEPGESNAPASAPGGPASPLEPDQTPAPADPPDTPVEDAPADPATTPATTPVTTTDTPPETRPDTTPDTTLRSAVTGTWLRGCAREDSTDPDSGFGVLSMEISDDARSGGSTARLRTLAFEDSGCTQPDVPAEIIVTSDIAYTGGTTETSRGTAEHIEATITAQSVRIDGALLTPPEEALLAAIGLFDTTHDLVLLDGSDLYLGEIDATLDGSSAALRPDELDTIPFVRQ